MNRRHFRGVLFAMLFVAVLASLTRWQWERSTMHVALPAQAVLPEIVAPAPVAQPEALPTVPESRQTQHASERATPPAPLPPLDLRVPPQNTPVNVSMQDKRMPWPNLFAPPPEQESDVQVGGHLILDDKPANQDATLRERLKGAEVRVDVKTN